MLTTSHELCIYRILFVFYALEHRDKEKRKKMGKAPTQIHANQPVVFRELMDSDSIYHKFLNRMIFFFFDGTSGNIIKPPSPK